MSSDYLELGTPHESGVFDLVVHGEGHKIIAVLKNVKSDPVRYHGVWAVTHQGMFGESEALFEDAKVSYFEVINFREEDEFSAEDDFSGEEPSEDVQVEDNLKPVKPVESHPACSCCAAKGWTWEYTEEDEFPAEEEEQCVYVGSGDYCGCHKCQRIDAENARGATEAYWRKRIGEETVERVIALMHAHPLIYPTDNDPIALITDAILGEQE